MRKICRKLKRDIKAAARRIRLNPYNEEFRPRTLNLRARDYGSFSDHCSRDPRLRTKSSKHYGCGLLIHRRTERTRNNWKIFYYTLSRMKIK